jgi:hypothetical protein
LSGRVRTESSWKELFNEPSRAELFKERTIPAGLESEAVMEGIEEPFSSASGIPIPWS